MIDDGRNVKKDFTCDRELLLKNMRYFEKYLNERDNMQEVDIAVHCDV